MKNELQIHIGGDMLKDAGDRLIDAWHRAERGEKVSERHLSVESWETLERVLTGKRLELLGYVRRHEVASIRALAKALQRDYSNVYADVKALEGAGLLEMSKAGIRADYDVIETKIAL